MNPFKYGQVVSADDFCPRPKLMKDMKHFIKSAQNIVVQGERRIGKTSLIYEAIRSLRNYRSLYIDLLEIKTSDDLCKRLIKALISLEQQSGFLEKILKSLSQLKPSIRLDPLTGQPSISLDAAVRLKPDSIDGLLAMIATVHRRKSVAVVFDEFQDVLKLKDSEETLAMLRSKIQFHAAIPYIFSGSIRNRMDEIFNHPNSAFFKSAISINVGPLDKDKFSSFLEAKFALGKRSLAPSVLEKIFEIAENIPGDIQQLCGSLWETTSYKDRISGKNIPESLKLIYSRESKGYEATLVQLTGQQVKCLVGLARQGGKSPQSTAFLQGAGIALPASVKKALNRLEQLKIIFQYQREYRFVNPFFKSWLIYRDF